MHRIELVACLDLDKFHLVVHMLIRKPLYQVKVHRIELVTYWGLDKFHLVVHTLVRERSSQVKQKVIPKVYCFNTFLLIQSFKNC